MSFPVALVFLLSPYAVWFGLVIGIIKLDQAARARRAAADPEPNVAMFEDRSITPYLLLSFICGALVLPVYFGSTRRSAGGFLLGLGLGVVTFLLTGTVAVVMKAIAMAVFHERLF